MRLALVHLSDIHLSEGSNPILHRVPQLVAASRSALGGIRHCLIALTGDVAQAGASAQYEVAGRLISNLERWLREELKLETLRIVLVPGNHDCNFLNASELRDIILPRAPGYVDSIDPAGEFAATCLSVQQEFFAFEAKVRDRAAPLKPSERLHYRDIFTVAGRSIRLECFNTSWLSRKHEVQGSLLFPISAITTYDHDAPGDVVISLFHHPYAWLESMNRREFQRYIERTSDVVLTGHEHEADHFRKELATGELVQYIEGSVLQSSDPNQSGFNVLLLDLDTSEQTLIAYDWRFDHYERSSDVGPQPFVRNRLVTAGAFENNAEFMRMLSDPGRGFTHPFKQALTLPEIYIYPDVRQRSLDKVLADPEHKPVLIRSEQLLAYIVSKRLLLIVGERDAGKTALAKMLYSDFQRLHSLVPLLMSGTLIKTPQDLSRIMKHCFGEQYAASLFESYRQLPTERRVIILDDFHLAGLNRKARKLFIETCLDMFGSVIVLADDLFGFQELSGGPGDSATPFADFDHCEIQPFGHVLRHRLVRKWLTLGRELTLEDPDIAHEIATKESVLNALIGANVIPPHPVLLLIILQAAESSRETSIVSGAYGYYYEVLITKALGAVSTDITETGGKYTYLSRLAFHMFKADKEVITEDELATVTQEYAAEYRSPVRHETILEQLIRSQILRRADDGVSFRYRYYYYYFVARYLKDTTADPAEAGTVKPKLYHLADHLFYEPYSNILIFYLYFTKDIELIRYLLKAAKAVFAEYRPCDFGADLEKINELFYAPPRRELGAAGEEEDREEYLSKLDQEEAKAGDQFGESITPENVEYSQALDLSLKFPFAFKLLQLLGQIIKNFPGELRGDVKLEIASECYHLGLRALSAFIGESTEHIEELKAFIEALLRERSRINPEEKMMPSAERILLGVMLGAGFGIVKRISYAVGHEQLRLTHEDVLRAEGHNLATTIIDLSIKLDYFSKSVPRRDIEELEHRVRDNRYCYTILQDLVFMYLYLFPTTFAERQRLGSLVDIKVRDIRLLEQRPKKLLT